MSIPERNLDQPEPNRTRIDDCYSCGEPVYEDEDRYSIEGNTIHYDCIKQFRIWGD